MRRAFALLALLAACGSSDKYVRVDVSDGRAFYARRAETEKVDSYGMIEFENVLTGKRVSVKFADCVIRSASRGEVTRARSNSFLYEK